MLSFDAICEEVLSMRLDLGCLYDPKTSVFFLSGLSFISFILLPVPPIIVEKNPVFPTFQSLKVRSPAEYEAKRLPFWSNSTHVTFFT
jgi:hypothetical protein